MDIAIRPARAGWRAVPVAALVFVAAILLSFADAYAFGDQFTNPAIAAGEAALAKCSGMKRKEQQLITCVAEAIRVVGKKVPSARPAYAYVAQQLSSTARRVEAAPTRRAAAAAIDATVRKLATAHQHHISDDPPELAKKHLARFAAFLKKAKSVLRS